MAEGVGGAGVLPPLKTRQIRILLACQAAATVLFAAIGWMWAGGHGAVSGALGGAIHLVANFVYALMGGVVRPATPGGALFLILRAEGFKVGLILVSLLGVLIGYPGLAKAPFILAFVATALTFGIAFSVRDRP